MSYYIAENDDSGSWSGVLVCIVIILIFVMLFRGLRGRQECVIYTGSSAKALRRRIVCRGEGAAQGRTGCLVSVDPPERRGGRAIARSSRGWILSPRLPVSQNQLRRRRWWCGMHTRSPDWKLGGYV